MGLAMTGSLLISHVATADDVAAGQMLYQTKLCFTCHGADAKTPIMPLYPKLAGAQNELYLFQQMKDIRDGKRTNGLSIAMVSYTTGVTDTEFQQIAKWLASLE